MPAPHCHNESCKSLGCPAFPNLQEPNWHFVKSRTHNLAHTDSFTHADFSQGTGEFLNFIFDTLTLITVKV